MPEPGHKWLQFLQNQISSQYFAASEYSQVQLRCTNLCGPFQCLGIAFIYLGFFRAFELFDHFETETRHLHSLKDLQVINKHCTVEEGSPHFALATQK